jgi:hypothetical protein
MFRLHLTFVKAVILILRHSTLLSLSNPSPESALTYVELAYQEMNIDLKIQQHLMASSQKHSVEQFSAFIMATDISEFILAFVKIISHHLCIESTSRAFSFTSVFCQNTDLTSILSAVKEHYQDGKVNVYVE